MTKPREVPEWLRAAVGAAVHDLPGCVLRELGAHLPGSFTRPDAIREALRQRSKDFAELPEWLALVLHSHVEAARTFEKMSVPGVTEALPILRVLASPGLADLGAWLDAREEVSRLAQPPSADAQEVPVGDPKQLWQDFVQRSFLGPHGCPISSETPPSPTTEVVAKAAPPPMQHELDRAQEHLRDAKRRHSEEKRTLESQFAREREGDAQREKVLQARLDSVEKELAELQKRTHSNVRREVQEVASVQFGAWFGEAAGEETFLEESKEKVEDLLHEADRVLQAQAEADRRHGNRVELRRRLDAFHERRDQLARAQVEAFRPVASLPRLIERLDHSIADLELRLGDVGAVLGLAGEIAAAIAGATNAERLDELGRITDSLRVAKVLSVKMSGQLGSQIDRQRKLLSFPGHPGPSQGASLSNPASLLSGDRAAMLLVDAYNLVGVAGGILGLPTECSCLPESLKRLIPMLRRYAANHPKIEICCVVDSPVGETRSEALNLRVIYSGGRGEHRADGIIDGHLRHLKTRKDPRPIVVVSADIEVRASAEGAGALVMAPETLARRLHRHSSVG